MGFLGLLIGVSISFLNPAKENDNLLFVFICGIISVSGMTLPGLSGSFILILLGNYVLLLVDSVNALYDTFAEVFKGDFSFAENEKRLHTLLILATLQRFCNRLGNSFSYIGLCSKAFQTYYYRYDHWIYNRFTWRSLALEKNDLYD